MKPNVSSPFLTWCRRSFLGNVFLAGAFFSVPMFIVTVIVGYQEGQPTLGWFLTVISYYLFAGAVFGVLLASIMSGLRVRRRTKK